MVVQHNLMAMNTNRMLGLSTKAQAKKTERLSSGYKINRAADDAAGLAISEKMRRQIRGLTQASLNAQDGVSLAQVADGALAEMHDIVQRMNELAVKSANGTNTDTDRGYIQAEVDQLKQEINRISKNTSFNEIYLFNREPLVKIDSDDYGNVKMDKPANVGGTNYSKTNSLDFSKINSSNIDTLAGKGFKVNCSQGCSQYFEFKFVNDGTPSSANIIGAGGTRPSLEATIDISGITNGADLVQAIYDQAKVLNDDLVNNQGAGYFAGGAIPSGSLYIGHANALAIDGSSITFFASGNDSSGKIQASDLDVNTETIFLQVGAEAGQHIGVNLYTINSTTLGLSNTDVSTVAGSNRAIDEVKGAILQISQYRSYYGSIQNRLEHTINNLDNIVENTTAAESLIRDTDMASTMVDYSNNNIIMQAAQAMLAQANQSSQGVLSLLG